MNLGYWNSCNPMNRMAHLNWKGTIRMKYSPRLKETIISIFHNRNSWISIHVIFTKSGFWFSKMLQMLHLVRVSVVKDDFLQTDEYLMRHMVICGIQHGYFWFWKYHFWRNSAFVEIMHLTYSRRFQIDFDQINGWTFLGNTKRLVLFHQRSGPRKCLFRFDPVRAYKMQFRED